MSTPTFPQMQHFFRLVEEGKITSSNLQTFLEGPARFLVGLQTTRSQSSNLTFLINRAVGENNLRGIHPLITPEHFPIKIGGALRSVSLMVERYLDGEKRWDGPARLVKEGYTLANIYDLANFLYDHSNEVAKWERVYASSKDSCSVCGDYSEDPAVLGPFVTVEGTFRRFWLDNSRAQMHSRYGILVLCK
ncbi:MAG: hypothetical protein G01um101413_914 [Parcubacteria group bacterium Gr01-1014_13]|nr:MAG: hypothetical protein G01um101413_914 [Parcubacteria group bacterium Gr01-1014_13]